MPPLRRMLRVQLRERAPRLLAPHKLEQVQVAALRWKFPNPRVRAFMDARVRGGVGQSIEGLTGRGRYREGEREREGERQRETGRERRREGERERGRVHA